MGTAHSGGGWVQSPFGQLSFFFFFFFSQKSGAAAAVPAAQPPTALYCDGFQLSDQISSCHLSVHACRLSPDSETDCEKASKLLNDRT